MGLHLALIMPFRSSFFSRLLIFLGLFFHPTVTSFSQTGSYNSVAEELLEKSKNHIENEDFRSAIATNQAMGILKETSRNHPLRIQVEKQLRIAKGRSIVAKYSRNKFKPVADPSGFLPLEDEPKDFSVSQVFGELSPKTIGLSGKSWRLITQLELGED